MALPTDILMSSTSSPLYSADLGENGVNVQWCDGFKTHYTGIWLRHSPGFPGGSRPAGPNGRFPRNEVPVSPASVEISNSGSLAIRWTDGTFSTHDPAWLRDHAYDSPSGINRRTPILWNKETIRKTSPVDFSDTKDSASALLALSEQILDLGVALLTNVPTEKNIVAEIGGWFGHVPVNLYADQGDNPAICNIRVDPSVTVATNMAHFLGPHTDTCWRQTLIGLLLMHCLEAHPEGGRSIVVDGFAIAQQLREQDTEAFDLLARVPLNFESQVNNGDDWRVRGRVLSVAAGGQVEGIRYNGNSIGQLDLPKDLIEPTYHALETFESILYDQSFWWQPRLGPGDLLILDNHRVLHGREAFDPALGRRHLQCCGVDRDDFHNRYRQLCRKLDAQGAESQLCAGVI